MQAQAHRQRVTLRLEANGEAPSVAIDGARMERAVGNLVRNALEHTPSGGQVDVAVFAEHGFAGLRVCDSGDGIDVDDLPRIWERFYRAERSRRRSTNGADGAGLGLAIVKGIVEAHGGAVEASSAPGRGATFTVRLPAAGS
jgi:two-component system sensor histidine kinase BaeS